jgi:hypothetical protein
MDKNMMLNHLAQAERHVSEGLMHIARQKQIIVKLMKAGHDTTMARSLLVNFEDVLENHIADRDRLKKELAGGP